MKMKFKRLVSLLTVAAMSLSFAGAVALADDSTVFLSSTGLATTATNNASVYTNGAWLYEQWAPENSGFGNISNNLFTDKIAMANINVKTSATPLFLVKETDDFEAGISRPDNERYKIFPLIGTGSSNINKANSKYFKNQVTDFANATLTVDMTRLSYYTAAKEKGDIVGIKMGLAHVYYDGGSKLYTTKGTKRYVYPADIQWIDITNYVDALPQYTASNTYANGVGQISLSVRDIIANGTHKYIHGAEADNDTYRLTANNADAVVFGIILKDNNVTNTNNILFVNNITVTSPTPTPEPAPEITPNLAEIGSSEYMTFQGKVPEDISSEDIDKAGFAFINVDGETADEGSESLMAYWTENTIENGKFGAAIEKDTTASSSAIWAIPYVAVKGASVRFGTAVKSMFEIQN